MEIVKSVSSAGNIKYLAKVIDIPETEDIRAVIARFETEILSNKNVTNLHMYIANRSFHRDAELVAHWEEPMSVAEIEEARLKQEQANKKLQDEVIAKISELAAMANLKVNFGG